MQNIATAGLGPPSLVNDNRRPAPARVDRCLERRSVERSNNMRSSNSAVEGAADPPPVRLLAHWLLGTTTHVALGLLIGMVAARLLRSRHLHWSWAAAGLAAVALLRPALGSMVSTLGVASLSATAWSRRWHREDIQAGGDLAEVAADRRRPLDLLLLAARRARLPRQRMPHRHGRFLGERLMLGHDESSRAVSIPFGGGSGGTHTLVVGATGSGKTVTQTLMTVQAIESGMGAVVIDPKGDRGMHAQLRRTAEATG